MFNYGFDTDNVKLGGSYAADAKGDVFCVEGTVASGKTPIENSFFDTLYIQDSTGGINLFPVSGTDIKAVQKVRAIGSADEYMGDKELRVNRDENKTEKVIFCTDIKNKEVKNI